MGVYQNFVQQRHEAFGPLGSRYGDGHRPARNYHAGFAVAQVDSVTISDADDGTTLNIVIDGIRFEQLDGAGDNGTAQLFVDQINSHYLASQIVMASNQGSGILYLTARSPGTAFTMTAGDDNAGASTATAASVTANNAGVDLDAGQPMFRPSGGTDPGLCRLPAAVTDIFLGISQHRHRGVELEHLPSSHAYPAGSQVPVDPDGEHVVLCSTGCSPGDPVHVSLTTGLWRNSGLTSQVTRVTVAAAPTDSVAFSLYIRRDDTGEVFAVLPADADASSTDTEVRDLLGDFINAHLAAAGFTAADQSTNAIDITGPAGVPFTVLPGNVAAELTIANQSGPGSILIPGASWTTSALAGNKAIVAIDVP